MKESVGSDFQNEQKRVRELLDVYKSIGPVGRFGATVIEQVLTNAEKAAISGDPVAILQAYQQLKDCE